MSFKNLAAVTRGAHRMNASTRRVRGRRARRPGVEDLEGRALMASLVDLGTLGGADSLGLGINDSGQVVGQSDTADGHTHAFLYSQGVMADLGTLGGANI